MVGRRSKAPGPAVTPAGGGTAHRVLPTRSCCRPGEAGSLGVMPSDIGVVDLMIEFPSADARRKYDSLRVLTKDAESQGMEFPAEYMFKDVPDHRDPEQDPVAVTLAAMDRHGIAIGLVGLGN